MLSPEAIKHNQQMDPADLFMYVHILVHMFLIRKKLKEFGKERREDKEGGK